MVLPLDGLRILAVEQYGAGPFGTLFLADQGAEVIKIENPNKGGDFARDVGPYFFTETDSEFFHAYNRNKKSFTLDLSTVEGQTVFSDLARTADAIACNLRGDVPEKLGLTYSVLSKIKPSIVCAHLSAYGRTGPRAAWPGFDYLMQAEAGYFSLTGEPGGPPTRFGLSVVDQMTGLALAYSLLAGVMGARVTGKGRDMDVSLFDIAMSNNAYPAIWYLNEGHIQGRMSRSAHPVLCPCQLYKTQDGWIYIMCNKEKFWPALCEALDRGGWITDSRFEKFPDRRDNREIIQSMLDEALSEKKTQDWLQIFGGKVPAAPVNDLQEALDNDFMGQGERILPIQLEGYGTYRTLNSPIKCGDDKTPNKAAPQMGADTDDLLQEIGYNSIKIKELKKKNII